MDIDKRQSVGSEGRLLTQEKSWFSSTDVVLTFVMALGLSPSLSDFIL